MGFRVAKEVPQKNELLFPKLYGVGNFEVEVFG
jgi:hypothetical protein